MYGKGQADAWQTGQHFVGASWEYIVNETKSGIRWTTHDSGRTETASGIERLCVRDSRNFGIAQVPAHRAFSHRLQRTTATKVQKSR